MMTNKSLKIILTFVSLSVIVLGFMYSYSEEYPGEYSTLNIVPETKLSQTNVKIDIPQKSSVSTENVNGYKPAGHSSINSNLNNPFENIQKSSGFQSYSNSKVKSVNANEGNNSGRGYTNKTGIGTQGSVVYLGVPRYNPKVKNESPVLANNIITKNESYYKSTNSQGGANATSPNNNLPDDSYINAPFDTYGEEDDDNPRNNGGSGIGTKVPIGDALWLLIALSAVYIIFQNKKIRKGNTLKVK